MDVSASQGVISDQVSQMQRQINLPTNPPSEAVAAEQAQVVQQQQAAPTPAPAPETGRGQQIDIST